MQCGFGTEEEGREGGRGNLSLSLLTSRPKKEKTLGSHIAFHACKDSSSFFLSLSCFEWTLSGDGRAARSLVFGPAGSTWVNVSAGIW